MIREHSGETSGAQPPIKGAPAVAEIGDIGVHAVGPTPTIDSGTAAGAAIEHHAVEPRIILTHKKLLSVRENLLMRLFSFELTHATEHGD